LQTVLGEFSFVPIMLGDHISDPGAAGRLEALAAALAELKDEDTLLVASTDLSHLDNYADVVRIDRKLVELVGAFDVDGLQKALAAGEVQACGATGLVAALSAARRLGGRGAQVLAHTTSGDETGDKRPGVYTVGYLAAAAYG
jgi:AmmeMemoRadiSam system protein B